MVVSIHALVKRATEIGHRESRVPTVSIHALVKRATRRHGRSNWCVGSFDPRPREEGDHHGAHPGTCLHEFRSTPS